MGKPEERLEKAHPKEWHAWMKELKYIEEKPTFDLQPGEQDPEVERMGAWHHKITKLDPKLGKGKDERKWVFIYKANDIYARKDKIIITFTSQTLLRRVLGKGTEWMKTNVTVPKGLNFDICPCYGRCGLHPGAPVILCLFPAKSYTGTEMLRQRLWCQSGRRRLCAGEVRPSRE